MSLTHSIFIFFLGRRRHPLSLSPRPCVVNLLSRTRTKRKVTLFTTRDTFDGKTVLELRYEAYVPMAIGCIKSICSSSRSKWNLKSIAVAHRLGPVPVGETSVFIAISAVHRTDALDACKFLIDEIKASVPIWKKEVYTNREAWKENSEFLERRSELAGQPGKKVKDESHSRRGCCGHKIKMEDEAATRSS